MFFDIYYLPARSVKLGKGEREGGAGAHGKVEAGRGRQAPAITHHGIGVTAG